MPLGEHYVPLGEHYVRPLGERCAPWGTHGIGTWLSTPFYTQNV